VKELLLVKKYSDNVVKDLEKMSIIKTLAAPGMGMIIQVSSTH
jgi:hypothetical protein